MPFIKSSFYQFLCRLDVFRLHINFFFDSNFKRSTNIGIFFSLVLIALILQIFSQSDFFLKQSPYIISQVISSPHAAKIQFNEKKLMAMVLGDSASNVNLIDPGIFTVVFYAQHAINNQSGTFIFPHFYELEVCDTSQGPGLVNGMCLKNKTFSVEGYWDETEISYAYIGLFVCNNMTSNNTCKPKEEIDKFFTSQKYFGILFHNAGLEVSDYDHPFKEKGESILHFIDRRLSRKTNVFFRNIELVKHDSGFFSNPTTQELDFARDYYTQDFSFRDAEDQPLSEILIYDSHDSLQYIRRYQTFVEALGSLAGTANFFIFLCFFIINSQHYLQSLQILLNSLYFFQNIENESKSSTKKLKITEKEVTNIPNSLKISSKINANKSKGKSSRMINDSKGADVFSNTKIEKSRPGISEGLFRFFNKLLPDDKKNDEKKAPLFGKLKIGFFEFLWYFIVSFCGLQKTQKHKLISKANELFKRELDVVKIIKEIHDIERMKFIFFDEDQLVLFNSLSKPMVTIESNLLKSSKESSYWRMSELVQSNRDANPKKFNKAYQNILTKEKSNHVNQRLLELVDERFKSPKL